MLELSQMMEITGLRKVHNSLNISKHFRFSEKFAGWSMTAVGHEWMNEKKKPYPFILINMCVWVLLLSNLLKNKHLIRLFLPTEQLWLFEMFIIIQLASFGVHIVKAQTIFLGVYFPFSYSHQGWSPAQPWPWTWVSNKENGWIQF